MISVQQEIDKSKFYRFNFPAETYCRIFWLGLEKIITRSLASMDYEEKMQLIYHKSFAITTDTISAYERYWERKKHQPDTDEIVQEGSELRKRIAQEILERLNRNKIIMVFAVEAPIFTIPFIAINPNESSAKVYALLDIEDRLSLPYKFTPDNTMLWRLFVWDKLKVSNAGKNIPYIGVKA